MIDNVRYLSLHKQGVFGVVTACRGNAARVCRLAALPLCERGCCVCRGIVCHGGLAAPLAAVPFVAVWAAALWVAL